ncbi:hypothetical protein [Streptomyces sp. HNM0574]|uniref:hypothetical protein n=1 Tax=Streptomyces sp. HNM0574 TaxID=2714954 RepID=UPI00146BB035|nr:hypothetical protein [Streptomyces sp. HNM0574]NLU68346.1 hypothetical protein [Streptomyces sp. HNM0574]
MPRPEDGPEPRNRPGDTSLTTGVVALPASFVPVLGDFLALVLGGWGIRHNERGLATDFGPSVVGATLGSLALLRVLLMLAVTA